MTSEDRPTPTLPVVERLQVATIEPGDTIIATITDGAWTLGNVDALRSVLAGRFPDQSIVIVSGGVELAVQRPGGES